jgi:HK97 family phage portal protein
VVHPATPAIPGCWWISAGLLTISGITWLPVSLIERLFGRAGNPASTASTVPAAAAPTPVPWVSGSTTLGLSAVWRCVTLIADAIADLPWRELGGPENAPVELPTSRLIRRPMAGMTRREWTWRVVATEALYNTVHLLYVGGYDSEGVPWSLLPIPPAAIFPLTPSDPWGLVQPSLYMVGGQTVSVDDMTIIRRAPFPGLTDQMAGILDVARRQFSAYLAADAHLQRYWVAGGPTITQITTDQELDDDQAADIANRWIARRAIGADYPAVFGKGAKAEPFGADPTTESAVEARREIVADVGRYFGVPTRILNAPAGDSETYANTENDKVDLLALTLRGYMGPVEDGISELLPGDYIEGRRMRLDPTRLVQGDLASRAVAYPALVGAGILSIPEVRAAGFGLAPMNPADAPAPPREAIPGAMVTIGG